MNKRLLAVIDALARQGIVADVARMDVRFEEKLATVWLRFDRVALRFVGDVRVALQDAVSDGKTLVFTITAPIQLPSKTAAALEDKVRRSLARSSARIDLKETINGNQIRVRLVKGGSNGARVVGFVHNPESDSEILFIVTQSCFG